MPRGARPRMGRQSTPRPAHAPPVCSRDDIEDANVIAFANGDRTGNRSRFRVDALLRRSTKPGATSAAASCQLRPVPRFLRRRRHERGDAPAASARLVSSTTVASEDGTETWSRCR